jgi:sarcosine oxidase subunit gamma
MIDIAEAPPVARFSLRGDAIVAARAGAALGLALPLAPHSTAQAGECAAVWLGPDEWLLLSPPNDLAAALAGLPHSLVDISDGFAALVLRGPAAARALSAGCPLDLHTAAFPPGMATRTILGRAGIILWRLADDAWRVEIGRSFTAYGRALLIEAARGIDEGMY